MSKKGKGLNPQQEEMLKEIANLLSRWVKSGSKNNLPVDKATGELRPKGSPGGSQARQRQVENILPEELLPLFQNAIKDGKLPKGLIDRLRKLATDVENARAGLSMMDRQNLDNRMRETQSGKNIDTSGLSAEIEAAAEKERQLRQELSTEILNAIQESMEEQNGQNGEGGEEGEENSQEAQDFEKGLSEDSDGEEQEGDDGQGEGDQEGESQPGDQSGQGEEGGENTQEAKEFEQGLGEDPNESDGDGSEESKKSGNDAAPGEKGSPFGKKAFDVDKSIEVDEAAVAQFVFAIESIMARQADAPDRLPKWNRRKLTKLLSSFRNPNPARKPILQQQDVVFILDNSGSMNQFEKETRALAYSIFETTRSGSKNSLVMTTTFNGQFGHEDSSSNQDECWVNGEYRGYLPSPARHGHHFKEQDYARKWEWWLTDYLPKEHGIRPKVVIFFSDDHGAFQWNYISNNLKNMIMIWLNPKSVSLSSFTEANGGVELSSPGPRPEQMVEWTRDAWVKGMSKDAGFAATMQRANNMTWLETPVDFRRFRGYFFTNVSGIHDTVAAIKRIASM